MHTASIFRVTLDGIHDVKQTLNYAEAKRHFLIWVEELSTGREVCYKTVTLSSNHDPVLEYFKNVK